MRNPSEIKCMRCGSTRHRTESTPNSMSGECLDCGTTWMISQNTWDEEWKPSAASSAQALDDVLRRAKEPMVDHFTCSCIVDQGEGGG